MKVQGDHYVFQNPGDPRVVLAPISIMDRLANLVLNDSDHAHLRGHFRIRSRKNRGTELMEDVLSTIWDMVYDRDIPVGSRKAANGSLVRYFIRRAGGLLLGAGVLESRFPKVCVSELYIGEQPRPELPYDPPNTP